MSVVGPKSTADVRKFLAEATGLSVLGCEFSRSDSGYLVLRCGYIDRKGEHRTKTLALGIKGSSLFDEVTDLGVMMSEMMTHGDGHMMDLLDASRTPETVQ